MADISPSYELALQNAEETRMRILNARVATLLKEQASDPARVPIARNIGGFQYFLVGENQDLFTGEEVFRELGAVYDCDSVPTDGLGWNELKEINEGLSRWLEAPDVDFMTEAELSAHSELAAEWEDAHRRYGP